MPKNGIGYKFKGIVIKGFWKKLKNKNRPILALAPMADVTDAAFRRIVAKHSKVKNGLRDEQINYVTFTEFVSCDGLCSEGRRNLLPILKYSEKERPIVAQIFGAKPENFYKVAKVIKKLGFDGIDINMGCPDKKVLKQGAGAALMKNPGLAREIIKRTKKGAGKLPVSIKTRIGYDKYDKKEFKKWLVALLETKPAAITIHGRTKKEMSLVSAHWDIIAEAVKIRNEFDGSKNRTFILGNGDVKSVADAKEKARISGVDGVMIGRAIFGNPWLFSHGHELRNSVFEIALRSAAARVKMIFQQKNTSGYFKDSYFAIQNYSLPHLKLSVLLEHAKLFEKINRGRNFDVMKKHFKSYVSGFPGAKELRVKLMACKNVSDIIRKLGPRWD